MRGHRGTRTASVVALAALAFAAVHASEGAYARPGTTQRVSVSTDGAETDGEADYPSISGDGRYVVFESDATTLVAGDSNESRDVFLHDLTAGTTELISVALDGGVGDAVSRSGAVSADGRYVAFESDATNLVPDDTNQETDIFVRDRQTGTTVLVSEAIGGAPAQPGPDVCPNRWRLSFRPSISADGSRIVFASWADNLVPGDTNGCPDIFLRDLSAGITERVSVSTDGQEADATSAEPAISGDGTVVVFESSAGTLVPADVGELGGNTHVYVRDLEAATTERASVSSDGDPGNSWSNRPTVSHDGRVVVFPSIATNLVPHDSNTNIDVFAHDRETGRTERVSVGSDGREGDENLGMRVPGVSADGRYVTFAGDPSNFAEDDGNDRQDVFVHDRLTGETQRISLTDAGAEGDGSSEESAISADGRRVVFLSKATELVPGDTNALVDVFVRDRGPELGVLDLRADPQAEGVSVSGRAVFSGLRATSASDPAGDGVGQLGADLTAASVAVRPESDDLLVRLDLTEVLVIQREGNTDLTVSGTPGVVYGLGFDAGGVRHEIRAGRTSAAAAYTLWRCDDECTQVADLTGAIGTVEATVLIAVPLSVLPEGPLSALEAFVDLGDVTQLLGQRQDSLALPDAAIPTPRVELGVAPAGTPQGQVPFDRVAELTDGGFAAALDGAELPSGGYDLWARACLGDNCGAASRSTAGP